ncbi:MAG: HAD family hydrolase [Erysipelotrichaceae bacterium]|nr:HAD family hydrolase [Erysipelotrichaceae bacterium]
MKEYRNYIFDLYGTLIDIHTDESDMRFWRAFRDVLSTYGLDYSADELRSEYFSKVSQLEAEYAIKGHHIEIDIHDVFEYLFKNKGCSVSEEIIKETAIEFRKLSTTHIRLYAHVEELLNELRKRDKHIYLFSNAQSLFTIYELKKLGLYDYFDDIFISSDIGYKKPDELFLLKLIDKHKLDKDECLLIGNDLNSDISCASKCGVDSYYIKTKLSSKENKNIHPTYHQNGMDIRLLSKKLLTNH